VLGGEVMAKKQILKKLRKEHEMEMNKAEKEPGEEFRKIITIFSGIVLILAIVYLISQLFIKVEEKENVQDAENIIINEILYGSILNEPEDNYYVLLYDYEGKDKTNIENIINGYTGIKIYTVDLSNGMNKSVLGEETNIEDDLIKVTDTTVIEIKNNKIKDYGVGMSEVYITLN